MFPENIDDLFRDKLDGHATPPGDDLWARLRASPADGPSAEQPEAAQTERLDQLFQKNLYTHPTPPRRELWERLEDEHLRPRKRRAAAWWPMALAAAVALFLVAGGAGLWLGFPGGSTQSGTVASQQSGKSQPAAHTQQSNTNQGVATENTLNKTKDTTAPFAGTRGLVVAANTAAQPAATPITTATQKNQGAEATRSTELASTASKASTTAPGQSSRHSLGTSRQPDAATAKAPLVARTAHQPAHHSPTPTAADELRPTTKPETLVATTTTPKPAPTVEIVPAPAVVPAASLASTSELITVDVRNGSSAGARPTKAITSALAAVQAPEERRGLGGRLLQQAGHLMRGERLSLAEATGLPENLTLRATVAGRSVTKSIQL